MKSDKKKLALFIIIVLFFMVAMTTFLSLIFSGKDEEKKRTIGFVIPGTVDEEGWNGSHYRGLKTACDELNVRLVVKENIKEYSGECRQAVLDLYEEGAEMIILGSYNYPEEIQKTIEEHSDISFYCSALDYDFENLSAYFGRMYQGRYLAGIIAGLTTDTKNIGYVAAMENNEVIRGLNAFALGVNRVRPSAKVHAIFVESWDNEEKEEICVDKLINECNIDVVTYHQNKSRVAKVADERGIYSIGYHEYTDGLSDRYLGAVVCDWSIVYREIVSGYLKGNANAQNMYWFGIEDDAINIEGISPLVSQSAIEELRRANEEIALGKDVFTNQIYDNNGKLRCSKGESIDDETLLRSMDWFVEGVEILE